MDVPEHQPFAAAGKAGPSPLLEAQGLSLTYDGGTTALQNINFAVDQGAFVSLVGPSGCGKSTLLRLVAGLIEPTAGRLQISGQPANHSRRGDVGFVFQQPTLLPWRTVAQNVRLSLELGGRRPAPAQEPVDEVLEMVGLSDFRNHFPRQLSGGMQMRVSLARALVSRPRLLLLDEPFAALDDMTRQRLNEELLSLWSQQQFTALFVTHNVSEAVFLSTSVLVFSQRPGTIRERHEIGFPAPRTFDLRATAEFAAKTGEIAASLRVEQQP